jgi:hypothetical protein
LGIPIASFLNRADQAKIESNWLTVETSAPLELTAQDVEKINNNLWTPKTPDANASEFDWQNYGEQLWRMGEGDRRFHQNH